MTAAGLVVTDLSSGRRSRHPGRFPRAGSVCCVEQAQEARAHDVIAMSRWYQRVGWVGECGESYPIISPARGRTCGRLVPVVMAVPPPAMPGGSGRLVVWFTVRARLFRVNRVGGGATARSW